MVKRFVCWLWVASNVCIAQSISTQMGARAAGMGYASATLQDEWASFNNIAGLAKTKNTVVGSAFEARVLPGANRMAAFTTLPFSFGVGALGVFRFGDDVYSEQFIRVGFANTIGKTALGIRMGYHQYKAVGFGTRGVLNIDVGGITQLTPSLAIGAWVQNINQPKINFNDTEKAPVKLLAAIAFKPVDQFILISEIEKDVLYKPLWKTGMEYWVHKKFAARAGFNINPGSVFFGIGYQSWRIKIDYALQSFTLLGPSHQASATYRINNTEK
jgi:hypothetical protein